MRIVALCLALGFPLPAPAFVSYVNEAGAPLRWDLTKLPAFVHTNVVNRSTRAVRYFIASDAYSSANRTAELNAARACFAQWQSVPGTILKFEEGGTIGPGADINTQDNTNVVFWAKSTTIVNGGFDDIRGLRGYTVTAFTVDNTLLEADTVLNGVDFVWRTDFTNPIGVSPFIEATLLHEIGHFIGLDHSPIGAATVFTEGGPGLSTEAGLSSDDVAAVRALYPAPGVAGTLGYLRGRITTGGSGVFGAMVVAENDAGNIAAGTVSRANGSYELPAMSPGNYHIRVSPLDPSTLDTTVSLVRGIDIAADYAGAHVEFLPSANHPVTLKAGITNKLDLVVTSGQPPFRIAGISRPTDHPQIDTSDRYASSAMPGMSYYVGVVSRSFPTNDITVTVTGDGITHGQTTVKPNRFFGGVHVLSVRIEIAATATPGMRSLFVRHGTNVAYANGFLEIMPPFPDYNFDGLDDRFQRRYFPLFTHIQAGPGADADNDGFDNTHEFQTGSDPTDPQSLVFRIERVTLTRAGTLVRFESAPGKRYQVYSRRDFPQSQWEPVGAVVASRGFRTEFLDSSATDAIRFYRVRQLP